MQSLRLLYLVVGVCLISAGVFAVSSGSDMTSMRHLKNHARIEALEDTIDCGQVQVGNIVSQTFTLRNTGVEILKIFDVVPSCGCMVASIESRSVIPGGATSVLVNINTNGKSSGHITKTVKVHSSSLVDSVKTLTLTATLFDTSMMGATAHAGGRMHVTGIFEGKCAQCHVTKGIGKLNAGLFEASCAMCHDASTDHSPAKPLSDLRARLLSPERLRIAIGEGIANSNMPAFGKAHGGPLSEEQIQSLIHFIASGQ
jgi:mono/diheme cytochrome c family protein